ncbi:MAG: DUF4245 family protein [Candidatus Nanopelagicales bacterium]
MAKLRGFETVRDMVLSMAVVGAVVAALFLVVVWQRPEVQGAIRPTVDASGLVAQVNVNGPFVALQPANLPTGWEANSAWFDTEAESGALGGALLHVGYITPTGSYAEVKQTNGDPSYALQQWTDGGVDAGSVVINGERWTRLESADSGTKALEITPDSKAGGHDSLSLVVVTGKADWPELEQLASSLS